MSFSTESNYSGRGPAKVTPRRPQPQRVLSRLRYDGDEVPVLIRLSELSFEDAQTRDSLHSQSENAHQGFEAGQAASVAAREAMAGNSAAGGAESGGAHASHVPTERAPAPTAPVAAPVAAVVPSTPTPPTSWTAPPAAPAPAYAAGPVAVATSAPIHAPAHAEPPASHSQPVDVASAHLKPEGHPIGSQAAPARESVATATLPASQAAPSTSPSPATAPLPARPPEPLDESSAAQATNGADDHESQPRQERTARKRKRSGTGSRSTAAAHDRAASTGSATISIPFDRTKILLAAGLVLVTAVTYYVLQGGNRGTPPTETDPSLTVSFDEATRANSKSPAVSEPQVELWPANAQTPAKPSSQISAGNQPSDRTSRPSPEYGATPNRMQDTTAPRAHSIDLVDHGPVPAQEQEREQDLWPSEADAGPALIGPCCPSEGGSTTSGGMGATDDACGDLVEGWPDEIEGGLHGGSSNPYYDSGFDGYETQSAQQHAPSLRTGMRESPQIDSGTNAESQPAGGGSLQGTIEIPRARANHERDGSRLY